MKRGTLVAFEGIDGAGKSTQLAFLASTLRARGFEVTTTREPTDGHYGRLIRESARTGTRAPIDEELGWFVDDRREHVSRVIEPALRAARVVLTDRYYLSTVAYQGARGLDPERLLRESEAEFPRPHLTLLLEIDPSEGLERVHQRGDTREVGFEEERVLRGVREIFDTVRCAGLVRVDARGSAETVRARVIEAVDRALPDLR